MQPDSRQFVVDLLTSSQANLQTALANLTPGQWSFRETPERWSIVENLEHLVLFEAFVRSAVKRALDMPAEPHKVLQAREKQPLVLDLANSRGTKFNAREVVRPTGAIKDPDEMIAAFRTARAATLQFTADTQDDLTAHFFPHIAFGDLDCYQWLIVIGQHTLRHVRQIEEIKADPGFPR